MTSVITNEVHTKMCKKIAQLTKVIYTLHTKSEEHDSIVDALKKNYEKDFERITSESDKKIAKMKEKIDNYTKIERSYEKLKSDFDGVKKESTLLEERLESIKKSNELNANLMKTNYENKCLQLESKLLEEKQKFKQLEEKLNNVLSRADDDKHKQMTSITLQHHDEIEQLKDIHKNNMSQAQEKITKLNEAIKYLEDEKLSFQGDYDMKALELKAEYENKILKLKEFHRNEKEVWKSSLSKDLALSWAKEKEELLSKHENAINNSELINTEQKYRINYLEKSINEKEIQIENYQANCGSLDFQIKENLKKVLELEDIIKSKDVLIDGLKNEVSSSSDASERLNSLRKHLLEATNKIKEMEQKHSEDMKGKAAHIKTLEKSSSELANQLQNSKTEFQTAQQRNEEIVYENSIVKQQYADAKEEKFTLSAMCKKLSTEIESLKKVCKTHKDDFAKYKENSLKEKDKMKREFDNEIEKLNEKHSKDIDRFKKESEKILKHSQGQLIDELTRNQEKVCAEQKRTIEEKEQLIQDLQSKYDILSKKFKDSQANVINKEESLKEIRKKEENLYIEIKNLKNGLTESEVAFEKLKEKLAQTRAQLEAQREEALAKQAKNLQDENNVVLEHFKNKLHAQHETKMKEIMESFKEEKQGLIEKLMLEHGRELEKVKYLKDEEIYQLKKEMESLKGQYEEDQTKSRFMLTKLEQDIKDLHKEINQVNKSCEEKLIKNDKEAKQKYSSDLENIHANYKGELSKQKDLFEKQLSEMDNDHKLVCSALKQQYASKEKQATFELKEQFTKEKETLQEFLQLQNEEASKVLKNEYNIKLEILETELNKEKDLRKKEFDVHTRKILEISSDLEKSKESFNSLQDELDSMQMQTMAIRKELELKVQEVLEVRRECNSRMRVRMEELSTDHRTVIDNIQANHMTELRAAMKEWMEEKKKLENELSAYKELLRECEEKYSNRPSRDEDIEHIKHLQENLLQQDIYCQQLQEEKKLFKLELVNREENFNRVFSSNPNVGFLNPIDMTKKRSAKKKDITARYSGK